MKKGFYWTHEFALNSIDGAHDKKILLLTKSYDDSNIFQVYQIDDNRPSPPPGVDYFDDHYMGIANGRLRDQMILDLENMGVPSDDIEIVDNNEHYFPYYFPHFNVDAFAKNPNILQKAEALQNENGSGVWSTGSLHHFETVEHSLTHGKFIAEKIIRKYD